MKKLVSLYHRRASSRAVRASSNRLVRLAARGGLPTANDLATAQEQIAAVAPFFDAGFYPSWYGITADPVRDYLVQGRREGRNPRPDFSSAADLPYLARAGINPFLHLLASQRRRKGPVGGRGGEEGSAVLASPTRLRSGASPAASSTGRSTSPATLTSRPPTSIRSTTTWPRAGARAASRRPPSTPCWTKERLTRRPSTRFLPIGPDIQMHKDQ